jgi:hypothetical protein
MAMSQNISLLAQPQAVNDGDHFITISLTTEYSATIYNNFHGVILVGKHSAHHSVYFHICHLRICFTDKFYSTFTDKVECNCHFLDGTA